MQDLGLQLLSLAPSYLHEATSSYIAKRGSFAEMVREHYADEH